MRCAEKVAAAYVLGQRDALDAAREAVANTPMRMGAFNTKAADLAAIDALRKESND